MVATLHQIVKSLKAKVGWASERTAICTINLTAQNMRQHFQAGLFSTQNLLVDFFVLIRIFLTMFLLRSQFQPLQLEIV